MLYVGYNETIEGYDSPGVCMREGIIKFSYEGGSA